jgi:hypothetical protein
MWLCLATLHTPSVVADTIVGREAADHGTNATFDGFRKKLFGETGWDNKDRFVVMDTGRTVDTTSFSTVI